MKKSGFTLIELLIVVAIIAILAAIAVPNFLEAQTRAKSSRVKSDMRTINTGLESYYVDYNAYPQCNSFGTAIASAGISPLVSGVAPAEQNSPILEKLTTPIAYLSTVTFRDPFKYTFRVGSSDAVATAAQSPVKINESIDIAARFNTFIYQATNSKGRAVAGSSVLSSFDTPGIKGTGWFLHSCGPDSTYINLGGVLDNDLTVDGPILLIYDPTNGTISFGSIFREGGSHDAGPDYGAGKGLAAAIRRTGG